MSLVTVIGGTGFIGSEIVKQFRVSGYVVNTPHRGDENIFQEDLGIVVYAAGYGDCNKDPINVVDANLGLLKRIIKYSTFKKLVYISSTRVYLNQEETFESANLEICSSDPRRLFNLTKITAEELCLNSVQSSLIIRPSNVYGVAVDSPLFLPSIVRSAILNGEINMYVTEKYEKDYIYVGDLVKALLKLISNDVEGVINIASGENTSAKEIANIISMETKCKVNWLVDTDLDVFYPINISKIEGLIDFKAKPLNQSLNHMINEFKCFYNRPENR